MTSTQISTRLFWLIIILLVVVPVWFVYQSLPRASARARCILQARNTHQAMRDYQNEHNLSVGDPVTVEKLIQLGYLKQVPECPKDNNYIIKDSIPDVGVLFIRCSDPSHIPANTKGW